jgi:hypothetical protein
MLGLLGLMLLGFCIGFTFATLIRIYFTEWWIHLIVTFGMMILFILVGYIQLNTEGNDFCKSKGLNLIDTSLLNKGIECSNNQLYIDTCSDKTKFNKWGNNIGTKAICNFNKV